MGIKCSHDAIQDLKEPSERDYDDTDNMNQFNEDLELILMPPPKRQKLH